MPTAHDASFRDPDGCIFTSEGTLYRQVNLRYRATYDRVMDSGLYEELTSRGLLIPHRECPEQQPLSDAAYRVLRPEPVPFISYPYEWCFSQLKDAALLTLDVQAAALRHDLSLKDCSAFNVQFLRGTPVFIDTLSFEPYQEGAPWVAYRQFCEHFLAPLALMACTDVRLNGLLAQHLHGIPLPLAAKLLPFRTRFNPGLLLHLHLHAGYQDAHAAGGAASARGGGLPRQALLGLLEGLRGTVQGLDWLPRGTAWGDYYDLLPSYSRAAFAEKRRLVESLLDRVQPRTAWDVGANAGVFSRLASQRGIFTVSSDYDHAAIEQSYRYLKANHETALLPLVQDLTNPSPGLGWMGRERMSLFARGPADLVMALALMHHLVVGNNLPLPRLVDFFAAAGTLLLIEFVPVADPQVQGLLATCGDHYGDYTQASFEAAFARAFRTLATERIPGSERTLYLMEKVA
jgi:hypothetical protein